MSTVEFMKDSYALKEGRDVSPKAKIVSNMTTPELAALYSTIASNLGKKGVSRFADKPSAVKRTWAILQEYAKTDVTGEVKTTKTKPAAKEPKAPAVAKEKKPGKKPFRFNFNFAPDSKIKPHREGSKGRATVITLLSREGGATFEEVQKATGWDTKTAYEGIRLIHFALGWGMRLNNETGKISIYRAVAK